MPKRDFELEFDFDSDSWGELDFASETEMKAGEEQAKEEIRRCMENPFDMEVPILISMDCAHSWGEAK